MLNQRSPLTRLGSCWVLLFLLAVSPLVAQEAGKDDPQKAGGKDDEKKEQPIVPKD